MNIYKHEMRAGYKTMIIWILAVTAMSVVYFSFYPLFSNDLAQFKEMMSSMPDAMRKLFDMQIDAFGTAMGFYGFVANFAALLLAIQAMNLGLSITSKEETCRTADFLLTKPVSRITILGSKLLSCLTILLATNIVSSVITMIIINMLSPGSVTFVFFWVSLGLLLMQLMFFSIGVIISTSARKIKMILPVSLGLVFAFYAISQFAVQSHDDKLRALTPFQYFKASYIISDGRLQTGYVIAGACIVLVCILCGFVLYKRRNIHAV